MTGNERIPFESQFKTTEIYKRESAIRENDILAFSETMNGYFNIVTNDAWQLWNKAKAENVAAQKYFSHDFNGDGFKYHDSLEDAQKEAEVNLDYYRDRVADGHHVADEGEFFELCYGVVIASADYTVDAVVSEDHHKNDEFTKYEVGTEILTLHFDKCNSESGAEQ